MTDVQQPSAPSDVTAAQARLGELSSNKEWAGKVLAQDPAAASEFQSLTKTIAGGVTTETLSHDLAAFNGAKRVDEFLSGPLPSGFPDLSTPAGAELAEILRGTKKISPELHQTVRTKLDGMLADREWAKRFDAKDQTAMREFQLATTLLTADVPAA